jgi:hypothetical protein
MSPAPATNSCCPATRTFRSGCSRPQQLHAAWAARERYRARAVRLARREAERDARRTPAPAPDVKPALPAAAAAILARAKARATGKER